MATTLVQIAEDQAHERKERKAEIVGWAVIAVLLALALTGVFGRGPLSHATAETDLIKLEYQKFLRKGADSEFVVQIRPSNDGVQSFWLSNQLLEKIEISRLEPTPKSSLVKDDGIEYAFDSQPGSEARVAFQFQPQTWGKIDSQIIDASGKGTDLKLYIYP